jgi:hypothetical protein
MAQNDSDKQISSGADRPLTYYDVLDLDRDARPEEIRTSYYELARQYHPDVVGQDQKAQQRFALIGEAYRVLSDPQRRYQYDRTLPQKSYPLRHPTPEKIWKEATDVVLLRSDRFGPLNQAMQATLPIGLDGELLVLTIPGSERHLAGHMETAANHNAILNALSLVYGQPVEFRLIDGSTLEDWEALKAAESRARAAAAARTQERHAPPSMSAAPTGRGGADSAWDEFVQRLHRQYQELNKRQFPQVKARFLRETLRGLVNLEEGQKFEPEADEDQIERGVARVIERIAAISDLPAVMVAMLFESVKRSGDL